MRQRDPVAERIAAHLLAARRRRCPPCRGRPLASLGLHGRARGTLEAAARGDRVEVFWWRRGVWGPAGPFGASFGLEDALAFVTAKPAFWIRA